MIINFLKYAKEEKILGAYQIILLSCLIVLGYFLVIKPSLTSYYQLIIHYSNLKLEFEEKQQDVARLSMYQHQVQLAQDYFIKIISRIPKKVEMSIVLDKILSIGQCSGLQVDQFIPQTKVTKDFYVELPIKMILTGDYRQLLVFLKKIAAIQQIIILNDFEISAQENSLLDIRLNTNTYQYSPPPNINDSPQYSKADTAHEMEK